MVSRHARSIHEADVTDRRRRRDRRLLRAVIALVAVCAVAGGGGAAYELLRGTSGSASSSPLAQPATSKSGSHVDVLVDGWTVKTLADKHLGYATTAGGGSTALTLRPVTDDDVAALLKTSPEIVTNTLARLATVDSALTCDTSGCHDGAGTVDPHWLVDPTAIPGYGASYAGYGITHGLYVARIDTTDAQQVQLVADGYDGMTLTAAPAKDANGKPVAPDIFNGYNQGRFLVGAGLGRFFTPRPAWLGSKGTGSSVQRFATVAPATPGDQSTLDPASPVVFLQGLAPAYPQTTKFGDTQLEYMTSPTTGCGTGVLCVPGTVTPKVISENRTAGYVCGTDGKHAAIAVLDDVHLSVKLPAPTSQFGDWNGQTPDTFAGHGKGSGMFTGTPPLAQGTTELRWSAVGFFDDTPPQLRVVAGETDAGPGADLTTPATLPDMLGKVRLDGAFVHVCP